MASMCAIDGPREAPLIGEGPFDRGRSFLIMCCIEHKKALAEESRLAGLLWSMGSLPAMISPSSTLIDTSLVKSPAYFC